MKCILDEDINECEYFEKETMECRNSNRCSFQDAPNIKIDKNYSRPEKWFEKYYK